MIDLLPFSRKWVSFHRFDYLILRWVLVGTILWGMPFPASAQLPKGCSGVDIESPSAGSESYANGVYTLTGSGNGVREEGDSLHFVYYTLPAGGNFSITARLVGFSGGAGSEAGLIVRGGTAKTDSIGAVGYRPGAGRGNSPNAFTVITRNNQPEGIYPWKGPGVESAMGTPVWLQLVRYGNNFAVYKSPDGKFWSQVHNLSGGAFSVAGPIDVGLFAAGGGTNLATATFDNVKLETNPTLPFETSWIGNSFSSDADSHVSGGLTAMWVGPDGSCYATSSWDEGGEPGKIYKDGKVVRPFTQTPGHSYEGAITSDGTHLYYTGQIHENYNILYQTDMSGSTRDYQSIYLQTPVYDTHNGLLKVSGLAYSKGLLYVSDPLSDRVLVVDPSKGRYGIVPYAEPKATMHAIDTSGVTNPAPEAVYQTSFQTDIVQLTIPNLTEGHTYNFRLHFAETNPDDAAVGKRLMNLQVGSISIPNYDIYADAKALYKATAVSFPGIVADASGKVIVTAVRSDTTVDRAALLSGVEVLNADGTPFKLINCAGPDVGPWGGTIQELPDRGFNVLRPGPMAVDKDGNLWIVQEGATFPATANFKSTPGWAAIKLYDKEGHYLFKQITDVVSPTALFYDATSDRLLVTENGPAQNIRYYNVYSGTPKDPVCTNTFGVEGGVFAGKTPGVIHDPDSGGDARFLGPTGVGMDSRGNLYVACNPGFGANQTDLRAFDPNGKLLWSLFGLEMTHTGDFDPTKGNSDVWTNIHHYTMDYRGSKAGGEWKLKSYITNPFKYDFPYTTGGGSAIYRRIGPHRTPILYAAGQGVLGPIYIYRFSGEQLVPCGSLANVYGNGVNSIAIWNDSNGDGIQQSSEMSYVSPTGGIDSFDVDNDGNIYLAMGEIGNGGGANRPKVEQFSLQGFDSRGAPLYSTVHRNFDTPEEFNDPNTGNVRRLRYAGGPLDTMYLLGQAHPGAKDGNYGGVLGCYDHWSTKPVKRFVTTLPSPADNDNFAVGAPPYTNDGFGYEAFDVANGYAFCSELLGAIHVIDPQGKLILNMIPGPEDGGLTAWEDENMGVRAHYNADTGEYDILQETSGYRAKQNFYRWFGPNGKSAAK